MRLNHKSKTKEKGEFPGASKKRVEPHNSEKIPTSDFHYEPVHDEEGFKERYLLKDFTVEEPDIPPSEEDIKESKKFMKKLISYF